MLVPQMKKVYSPNFVYPNFCWWISTPILLNIKKNEFNADTSIFNLRSKLFLPILCQLIQTISTTVPLQIIFDIKPTLQKPNVVTCPNVLILTTNPQSLLSSPNTSGASTGLGYGAFTSTIKCKVC
jgi:hypothetical protein